jgi:hypothetical protein
MPNKHKFDAPVTLRRPSDGAEREVQSPVDFVNAKYAGFELPEGADDPRDVGGVAEDSPTSPPADVPAPISQPPETTTVVGDVPTTPGPASVPTPGPKARQTPNQ